MKPDASARAGRAARRADRRAAVMLLEAVKARSDAEIARSVARRADAEEARRAAEAKLLDIEGEIARSDAQAAAAEDAATSFDNLQRYAQDTLRDAESHPKHRDKLPERSLGFEDTELLLRTALMVLPGHTNPWEFGDTTGLGDVCRRLVLWSEFMRWLDDTGRCRLAGQVRNRASPDHELVWTVPGGSALCAHATAWGCMDDSMHPMGCMDDDAMGMPWDAMGMQ
jgi:hypothetical protein